MDVQFCLTRSIDEQVLIYWKLEGCSMMPAVGSSEDASRRTLTIDNRRLFFNALRHKDHEAKLALGLRRLPFQPGEF
jgi:hypothetical protein